MNFSILLFLAAITCAIACVLTHTRMDPFTDYNDANYRVGFYATCSWALLLASNIFSFIGL